MASSQYFHEQSHQRQQQKTISTPPPTKLAIRLEGNADGTFKANGHFGNKKMVNGIGKLKNGTISNGHGPHLNGLFAHENENGLGDQENAEDLTIDGREKMPGELNNESEFKMFQSSNLNHFLQSQFFSSIFPHHF